MSTELQPPFLKDPNLMLALHGRDNSITNCELAVELFVPFAIRRHRTDCDCTRCKLWKNALFVDTWKPVMVRNELIIV